MGHKDGFNIHKSINVAHHINRIKDKNYMIILIDAGKASNKIQHPFMIKTLNKLGTKGMYFNIIKAISNITLNGDKLKVFPLRPGIKQGCPLLLFSFSVVLEIPTRTIGKK